MSELRFYFDESVDLAVSEQLAKAGLDVVSAHSLNKLGDSDVNHLRRATDAARVLCTCDQDFLILASQGFEHSGIIFAQKQHISIGDWVRELRSLHGRIKAEDARGRVFYVKRA